MRQISYSLLAFILMTGFAMGGEDTPTSCHALEDEKARLLCYDKVTGYSNSETSNQSSAASEDDAAETQTITSTNSKWVSRTSVSEIDDSTNVYLSLESDEYISGRYGDAGPMTLFIQCRENTTILYIHFNGHFMSDYRNGSITYRLDDQPAKQKRMRESNDNSALGLWSGGASIPFIKAMLKHQKMLVRATPHSESALTAKFSISGIEEEVKVLREACHW